MKKIVYISFSVLIVIMTIVNFLNFSEDNTMSIFDGLTNISIEQPDDMSNSEFIEVLENTAKNLNIDIAYQKLSNDAKGINIYKTNNTNDFMNINTDNNIQQISKNECISTLPSVKGYKVIPLYISTFLRNTTIYTFDKCVNNKLSETSFIIKEDANAYEFINVLNDKGINAQLDTVPVTFDDNPYNEFEYSFCLLLVVVLAIFISFIDNAKTHTLKHLEGYSSARIMIEESGGILLVLLIIFSVIEIINISMFAIYNSKILNEYILFNINSLIKIYLPIIVFTVLLSSLTVITHSSNLYIKGKVNRTFILYATATVKVIAFVFMCAPFISSIDILPSHINTYLLSSKVNDMLSSYVEPLITIGDNENNLRKFYDKAVKEYGAVLFTDEYQPENLDDYRQYFEQNYNLAPELNTYNYQEYVDCYRLTVNSNYLNLNPLHKPNGELITKKDFPNDKYNIMVSEDAEHTDAFVKYIKEYYKMFNDNYKVNPNLPINIVYYKSDEKILMLNSKSDRMYAEKPYVTVTDGLNEKIGNDCIFHMSDSSNSFILLNPKPESDDLYNSLLPLIKETNSEDIVYGVKYANDSYANELAQQRNLIMRELIQALLYGSLYVFLMIYFIRTYSENYRNDIAIRKLSGEGFFRLHRKYFSAVALMMIVTLVGVFINQMGYIEFLGFSFRAIAIVTVVPLVLWIIELIIFALYVNSLTHKSILKALKGD